MTTLPPAAPPPTATAQGAGLPGWVRPVLLANLVAQTLIVVTGGVVRVSGSGLGCPTWPECVPGSYTPVVSQPEAWHKYVEFGNRTLTSVVSATAVAALVGTLVLVARCGLKGTRRGRRLIVLAWLPLLLVATQAVVGGISVRMGLSPSIVALHMLLSLALIAVSTVLLLDTGPFVPRSGRPEVRLLTLALGLVAVVVVLLGTVVTGSGPHSGDATKPTRFGLDPKEMSWLHADVVLAFLAVLLALVMAARLTGAHPVLRRRLTWLVGITLAQGLLGYVQYFTKLPGVLVVTHMFGAALLTVGVTAVALAVVGTPPLTAGAGATGAGSTGAGTIGNENADRV